MGLPALIALALGGLALSSTGADRRVAAAAERELMTLRRANVMLERTQQEIIRRLCTAGECRDDDTGQHVARIAALTRHLALAAGCDVPFARDLMAAAPLHDIGKIGIPDQILHKPGKLTADETRAMQQHATIGANILRGSDLPLLDLAAEIAISHHENWDGTGYPHGLTGERIPLSGRIVAIADVFDALLSRRPYKDPWPEVQVREFLIAQAGKRFDPTLIALFIGEFEMMLAIRQGYDVVPAAESERHDPKPEVRPTVGAPAEGRRTSWQPADAAGPLSRVMELFTPVVSPDR
jgi:putative two-component system response regulator